MNTRPSLTSVRAYSCLTPISRPRVLEVQVVLVAPVYLAIVIIEKEGKWSQYPPIRCTEFTGEQSQNVTSTAITKRSCQTSGRESAEEFQNAVSQDRILGILMKEEENKEDSVVATQ